MEKIWQEAQALFAAYGVKVVVGLAVLIVGLVLSNKMVRWILRRERMANADQNVQSFTKNFVGFALKALVVIVSATLMGIPMTVFVALLSTASVAIGLAMQGALSNFAGGIILLTTRPFAVGDFIETTAGTGTVKDVNVLYTVLSTADNRVITIPNGTLTSASVTNYSGADRRRVDIEIGVAYGSDIEKVKSILLELAQKHEKVLQEPEAPLARLARHDPSALVFVLRVWAANADYWTVRFDLNEAICRAFEEQGIRIPFPQIEVHTKG